jgi:hypothetical protein
MEKAGEIIIKILKRIMERSSLKQGQDVSKGTGMSGLLRGWEQCLDPKDLGHSRIVEVVQDSIIVEVDHPGRLQMLKLKEKTILQKLKTQFPEYQLKSIRFIIKNQGSDKDLPSGKKDQDPGKSDFQEKLDKILENLKKEP